ncbi:hypothetical protein [Arcticibacter sp.]|uniref:hypothetical protein n=1 Tax=Arcticibacter sp. TaxID=1872630 RepID=UPI0038902E4B
MLLLPAPQIIVIIILRASFTVQLLSLVHTQQAGRNSGRCPRSSRYWSELISPEPIFVLSQQASIVDD